MVTAIDVFWKVWVLGFCVFLLVFAFSTWVLMVTGKMNLRTSIAMRQFANPVIFAKAIFHWFLAWPFILIGGISVLLKDPDSDR